MIILIGKSCYTFQMPKVSSDTQENLLIITSCKIRKQAISFQHTMARNTLSHSKRQGCVLSEGTLDQSKKPLRTYTKSCNSISDTWDLSFKRLKWLYPCNLLYISRFRFLYPLYAAFYGMGVSQQMFLNIVCSQNATQTSSSQLHAILCHSILSHWGYESAKQGWMEQC